MYVFTVTVLSILVILCTTSSSLALEPKKQNPSISLTESKHTTSQIGQSPKLRLLDQEEEEEDAEDDEVVAVKEETKKKAKKDKKAAVEKDEDDAADAEEEEEVETISAYETKPKEEEAEPTEKEEDVDIIDSNDADDTAEQVDDENDEVDENIPDQAAADDKPSTNSCSISTSCAECTEAAKTISAATTDQSCLWGTKQGMDTESCFVISTEKYKVEQQQFSCATGESYAPPSSSSSSSITPSETIQKEKAQDKYNEAAEEEEDGSIMGAFLFIGFFIGIMYIRHKILERSGALVGEGGGIVGGAADDLSTIMTNSTSGRTSSSGRAYNQETVPLSSAADEEWGWEDGMDSTGDVELSTPSTSNKVQEDDDLQMALALSLSENKSSSSPAPKESKTTRKTKAKKPPRTKRSSGGSVGSGGAKDKAVGITSEGKRTPSPAVDEWDEPIPSPDVNPPSDPNDIEALLESTRPKHMAKTNYITSFSKKNAAPAPPKKKEEKKKQQEEDDIFASMGLSSYPGASSTSKPKPSPPSSGSAWGASSSGFKSTTPAQPKTTAPAPRSTLLDATADLGDDGSDNWDDDSDLDDLLDD